MVGITATSSILTLGSIEHRAQVILYTLLMSDRYTQAVDAGLLFYLKSSHMISVPSFLHEKRALIMKRNEVARYLTLNRAGTSGVMPGEFMRWSPVLPGSVEWPFSYMVYDEIPGPLSYE